MPRAIRDRLGLHPGVEVEVSAAEDAVVLRKRRGAGRFVAEMRGRASGGLSTDEVMALMRGED